MQGTGDKIVNKIDTDRSFKILTINLGLFLVMAIQHFKFQVSFHQISNFAVTLKVTLVQ